MKIVYYIVFFLFALGFFLAGYKLVEIFLLTPAVSPDGKTVVITGKKYYVSSTGNDNLDGLSEKSALFTIQNAIDLLQPGDGVILADGTYLQDFVTRRNGTDSKPIIITGSKKAVIKGSGKNQRIIEINHDFQILKGFTVDGLNGDNNDEKNYRDKLIYAQGNEPLNGITGLRILDMDLKNAGGECVRIKYFAQKNEIAHNNIVGCGAYDFIFKGEGKNGEGIYIGTAPEQIADDKNPTQDIDLSNDNWIHDNFINTQGNECVDIKEGSSGNLVENNKCTGQKDTESAGLDSRGSGNVFRKNEVYGSKGAGIRLGGDKKSDGINNVVAENFLHDNENGGIKFQRNPQKQICGNRFKNNKKGDLVGEYGSENKNQETCK